jgi:tRNA(Arg) A34 adenosine deaminase TadA
VGVEVSPHEEPADPAPPDHAVLALALPAAVVERTSGLRALPDLADRMALVLDLARLNVEQGGGPFAAAVFGGRGDLVAAGVNLVLTTGAPVAHAEIVALGLAGQRLSHHDLGAAGAVELVTSCEPCAMCLGALPWSGLARVVCGARDADARAVGFDEGDKPADWVEALQARGIEVLVDVEREAAAALLRDYVARGGLVYNGTRRS